MALQGGFTKARNGDLDLEPGEHCLTLMITDGNSQSHTLSRWWLVLLTIDFVLLAATYLSSVPELCRVNIARPFNLAGEMNFAAWFSGMQLLLVRLALLSYADTYWNALCAPAIAVGAIGSIAVILFADEVGSVHERVNLLLGVRTDSDVPLLPFALILAALGICGMWGLFRSRHMFGMSWIIIATVFGIFALVFAQEQVEHLLVWSSRAWALRTVVEEGSEMLGFAVFLYAAVQIGRAFQGATDRESQSVRRVPVLVPSCSVLRYALVTCVIVSVPIIAIRLMHTPEELKFRLRGDFGYVGAVAAYAIASLACYRNSLLDATHAWRWRGAAAVCLLLSCNATALYHRFVLGLLDTRYNELPWRAERDLLWAVPVAMILLIIAPGRTSWRVFVLLTSAWLASLTLVRLAHGVPLATYLLVHAVAFLVCGVLVFTQSPMQAQGPVPVVKVTSESRGRK